jgi:hypothetical protein
MNEPILFELDARECPNNCTRHRWCDAILYALLPVALVLGTARFAGWM